jgi:Na+-transporting NADH:ubiquinone oxidoreductase subunit A
MLFFSNLSFGQTSSESETNYFLYSIIALGILLLGWAILNLTDNLMQIEAKKRGADTTKENFSVFPGFREMFGARPPKYAKGAPFYNLSKGHNILLEGVADNSNIIEHKPTRVAVRPPDFKGIAPIPKLEVAVGDEVKAGDPIFFDKKNPDVKYVAPVSGEIVEVIRGAKRAINEVVILADKEQTYREFSPPSLENSSREELAGFMASSGLLPHINQRPFDIVPAKEDIPRDIFISTFDTSPLAIDQNIVVDGRENAFQKGLEVLSKLTSGSVHLGLSANGVNPPHQAFTDAEGVAKYYFKGKHPAGNVGVQIHHIKPINASDSVWTLKVRDVIIIGEVFLSGKYDSTSLIAMTGSQFEENKIIKTNIGVNLKEILGSNLKKDLKVRLIDGNVLTGRTVLENGFLSHKTDQITSIKEGDYYELFGWLLAIKPRPTISRTYPNFLFPEYRFEGDTNTHGEKRAFVVTGQYESVLPMDIYPQHIMKAIMTNDFEKMEGLGLIELSEEDVALCEFVCTSKMPLQSILRQGLDMMRDQM